MPRFTSRIGGALVVVAMLVALTPGGATASPPSGFGPPHQVRNFTSCIGASATAGDGTDVVFSEGGSTNDVTFAAVVRRPGTTAWRTVPTLHVPAYSTWDTHLVAIGASDVLLSLAWYDASGHPSLTLYRLDTHKRTWSKPVNALPRLDHGDYENAAVGVTSAGGIAVASTYSTYDGSYHYSTVVGYRAPGSRTWRRATFGPSGSWQFASTVSVSKNGYVVVPFTREDATSHDQTATGVITRSPASKHWHSQILNSTGAVARAATAVGADGEALYAFSTTGNTVGVARTVLPHGDAAPSWATQTVTSSTAHTADTVLAAVDGRGHGTVLIDDKTPPLYAHLNGASLTGPFTLDNGARRDLQGISTRPDGVAVATATDYTSGGTPTFTGADAITFSTGGGASVHTLETVGNPWSDLHASIKLDSDAANRLFATFTTGTPSPDKCQFVDQPGEPDVMTSASSGHYVKHTRTHRLARQRVRCVSGFWVEARSLSYRWFRDGHRIRGAGGVVHKRTRKDAGHRLTCKVVASNHVGTRILGP